MSERTYHNLVAVLIVVVVLALIIVLGGCTRYHVVKGVEGTEGYTEVSVWSNRQFEAPDLSYQRSPDAVKFRFGAESALAQPSPLEAVGALAVQRLMESVIAPATEGASDGND